ncbi:MAG TPA: acetate uptake transporter [Rhodanobacteraceae bacterium]|nr:acetate uptake transporter [Rhodanobacteraceae bacterium]
MNRTANVSALGYGAFALTLWMNSMTPAGWFAQPWDNSLLLLLTVALGGCVLAIAGILRWFRGSTLDMLLFMTFAAYWWAAASYHGALADGAYVPTSTGFLGWYYMVWAFLAFCMWVAACRDGVARMLFTLGLWLSLFAFALSEWAHLEALTVLGGYLGLVTAVVGIYICAAEVINETHGHGVLPLGESTTDRGSGTP